MARPKGSLDKAPRKRKHSAGLHRFWFYLSDKAAAKMQRLTSAERSVEVNKLIEDHEIEVKNV